MTPSALIKRCLTWIAHILIDVTELWKQSHTHLSPLESSQPLVVALLLLAVMASSVCAQTQSQADIASYYPGALAHTHDLVAADGARTTFSFPSSWDDERGGLFSRGTDGCFDWHVWLPDALHYLGVDCPERRVNVMIIPITHKALPRRTALPWAQDFRTWEISITGDIAALGQPDLMRVSLERGTLDGEVAIVLQFTRRDGSGETWWLVDCLPIEPEGGCAPGMRRLIAFNADRVTWWDRRYARWEKKP